MTRHALFIGIDRYEDEQLRSLSCAESDAYELHGFFKHRAGFDDAECLLAPSSEQVLQAVERLTARLSPGDLFFFFFAGHGVTHEGQHLLLCAKARHSRLRHKQEVVPVDLLKEETARAGVHRVFVLDACRTDLLKTRQAGVGGFNGVNALRDVVTGSAMNVADGSLTFVCSCDEGGQAGEITSLRGGVFRLALQETLAAAAREERELAVGEGLVTEVERVMTRLAETHGIAARQRPWFQRSGEAPLLLLGRLGARTMEANSSQEAEARLREEAKARIAAEQGAAKAEAELAKTKRQAEELDREAFRRRQEAEAQTKAAVTAEAKLLAGATRGENERAATAQRRIETNAQVRTATLANPAAATKERPWVSLVLAIIVAMAVGAGFLILTRPLNIVTLAAVLLWLSHAEERCSQLVAYPTG